MKASTQAQFDRRYQTHPKYLKLKGLQPKTIDAYAHAIRRVGAYFDHQIDALTEAQLTDCFTDLIGSHSWSAVKLDLYGLKFFYADVLKKPWARTPGLIKPPKSQRLPDIVTVAEVQQIVASTCVPSCSSRSPWMAVARARLDQCSKRHSLRQPRQGGIAAQPIVVVESFVTLGDAIDPLLQPLQCAVANQQGIPRVGQGTGHPLQKPQA